MTVEKELELRAEYMNCRDDLGWCMVIMLVSGGCFFFCALKSFWIGVIVAIGIQLWATSKAEKYRDRMNEIMWEYDRG